MAGTMGRFAAPREWAMLKAQALWAIRLVVIVCAVGLLSAQAPTSPAFDAASVKPNTSGDARTDGRTPLPGALR